MRNRGIFPNAQTSKNARTTPRNAEKRGRKRGADCVKMTQKNATPWKWGSYKIQFGIVTTDIISNYLTASKLQRVVGYFCPLNFRSGCDSEKFFLRFFGFSANFIFCLSPLLKKSDYPSQPICSASYKGAQNLTFFGCCSVCRIGTIFRFGILPKFWISYTLVTDWYIVYYLNSV